MLSVTHAERHIYALYAEYHAEYQHAECRGTHQSIINVTKSCIKFVPVMSSEKFSLIEFPKVFSSFSFLQKKKIFKFAKL